MRVASYDIVFQEIPGEVTLALNLSGCPCHCKGCHSPHLWEDTGEELDAGLLNSLLERYGEMITCVAFMGGDQDVPYVLRMAEIVKHTAADMRPSGIKVAWYSGRTVFPEESVLDYIKLGPYVEALGGLKSNTTNQRFYKRTPEGWVEDTKRFRQTTFPE